MSESRVELPNIQSEVRRKENLDFFKLYFEESVKEMAHALESISIPQTKVEEWYDPSIEGAYFIHGNAKIGKSLEQLSVTWGVLNRDLNRYMIVVGEKGQGNGPKLIKF